MLLNIKKYLILDFVTSFVGLQHPCGQIYGSRSIPLSSQFQALVVLMGVRRPWKTFNLSDHLLFPTNFLFEFIKWNSLNERSPHLLLAYSPVRTFVGFLSRLRKPPKKSNFRTGYQILKYFEIYLFHESKYDIYKAEHNPTNPLYSVLRGFREQSKICLWWCVSK